MKASAHLVQPRAEDFHHCIRWKDFQTASAMVIDERRLMFLRARQTADDETNLFVSDYELENVIFSEDYQTAVVTSRLHWHRLPSVSVHQERIQSTWVLQGGMWYLAQMNTGPFSEMSAPYSLSPPMSR